MSRDTFGWADWGGKESCRGHLSGREARDAAKHPTMCRTDPTTPRIAQTADTAELEKRCSRDKGCIGKRIAFSKTHIEMNLSNCDCPRRAPLYHYNYTLCQGNSPQRSEKEMPYVADLLCAKDIAQVISSLAEMMLRVGFLLHFRGEEIEAQRACVSCSAATEQGVGFEPKSNFFGAIVSFPCDLLSLPVAKKAALDLSGFCTNCGVKHVLSWLPAFQV